MRREIISEHKVASCYFRSSVKPPHRKALLQITERCNLHCVHCFVSAGNYGDTMPIKVIHDAVIPKLKDCRVISVTLTGGEPFVHPDIIEIVHLLRNANIRVGICTNGTSVSQDQMETLAKIGNVHLGNNQTCKSCSLGSQCGKGCPAAIIASGQRIEGLDPICPMTNSSGRW